MSEIEQGVALKEAELKYLRDARKDTAKERDNLLGDLQGHQAEMESMYQHNKSLKNKIKRMEQMLYGRNIVKVK